MTKKRVKLKDFMEGDVYIDYPYEDVKFRFEKETGKVYRRWYRESEEMEIPYESDLYNKSHSRGWAITREEYFRDKPKSPPVRARRAIWMRMWRWLTRSSNR